MKKSIFVIATILFLISCNVQAGLEDGLVAHYKLDGTSGTVIDETGNNDGINVNDSATRGVAGKFGNAFDFDGIDDYVSIPNFDVSTPLSWSVWAYASDFTPNANEAIIGSWTADHDDAIIALLAPSGLLYPSPHHGYGALFTGDVLFADLSSESGWVHLAYSIGNGNQALYVNGNLESSGTYSSYAYSGTRSVRLGTELAFDTLFFDGLIDEVRIYNRALSVEEISLLFDGFAILYPNGSEELIAGQTETITWESAGDINFVSIDYSSNNGNTWVEEDPNTPNDGEYDWTVPQVTSNQCLVRVSDTGDPNVYDISDDVFTIYVCQIQSIADLNNDCEVSLPDFALLALDWLLNGNPFDEGYTEPLPIMWIYIDDPGVPTHEAFVGYMSKYETTNAQYCQFLNAALASGDITVSGNDAIGANGSNSGADYVGETYYNGDGVGSTYNGATNGGAARINYSGGSFSVDNGFEDHPVTYVSWYGATAFCNYYGYKLPSEWEWQAVADYDGSYIYGCGIDINNNIANYLNSTHPYGTTVVGSFGTYGYGMNDMVGNVLEWVNSIDNSGSYHAFRGGGWFSTVNYCTVSRRDGGAYDFHHGIGFRVCR